MGLLFVLFSRPIGIGFCRIGKAVWKGHEDDVFGKVSREITKIRPSFSIGKIYGEATAPSRLLKKVCFEKLTPKIIGLFAWFFARK